MELNLNIVGIDPIWLTENKRTNVQWYGVYVHKNIITSFLFRSNFTQ